MIEKFAGISGEGVFSLDSAAWLRMLADGLGAKIVAEGGEGLIGLVYFPFGPFRIGYADFPVGSWKYDADQIIDVAETARRAGIDVVRFHSREPIPWVRPLAVQDIGTRCITDLQAWTASATDKSRRARNRSGRDVLRVERATTADAARINALYRGTIDRNRGSIRYGERYFRAIADRTALVARVGGDVIGFVSFARRGQKAYYLHGGYDPLGKAHYPSDQLFYVMLQCAREFGATSFDFLPSPPGQDSLVRYKEAWGARAEPFLVSDLVLRPWRSWSLGVLRRLADALPRNVAAGALKRAAGRD